MRKSLVVLSLSALQLFCFALSLSENAVARGLDFNASQEVVESSDDALEFDADPVDGSFVSEGAETASENAADVSIEFDAGATDELQGAEDSRFDEVSTYLTDDEQNADVGQVVSDESVEPDEFEIDQNDILGSAFSGLIPSSELSSRRTFDLEKDYAVERVGVFSAGVWLKERVEQKKAARETERAKYDDSADVPDEYKTLDDFFATTTENERSFVDKEKKPADALGWFQFARGVAKVGRLEFAKRALEESFLTEPGELDASFLSSAELESDARQAGLDDAYVRLERGAFERLCLASFKYWSDSSRFDVAFNQSFNGSDSKRALALIELVRAGAYGAARFCRLSLDKYADFRVDARGRIVGGSAAEIDAYWQFAALYFERVGFGSAIAVLRGTDSVAGEAVVGSMKFTRSPYVWAELGLRYYDQTCPQSLRRSIENMLKLQYGKIPTRSQVVIMAYKQALGYYDRSADLPGETFPKTDSNKQTNFGADAKAFIWRWDSQKQEPAPVMVDVEYAYLYEAARLARAAYKLASESRVTNKDVKLLAIATTCELLVAQVGPDCARAAKSVFEAAYPNLTNDELAFTVQYAIKAKRCRGALIPMIILGDKGNSAVFKATRSAPSVVVQGASCADRRVRYEALRAVFKQLPDRDFNGSRIVIKALEWFASACGERVVVVLEPDSESAGNIAKRLESFGFVVRIGESVHQMLTEVQDEADLEFVFLPDDLDSKTSQEAAKALRMEPTTAETPLLVGSLDETTEVFDFETDSLAGLRFHDSVTPSNASCQLRARQAKCAAQALEVVKKLKSEIIDRSDKISRKIHESRTATDSTSSAKDRQTEKDADPKSKGKINFK